MKNNRSSKLTDDKATRRLLEDDSYDASRRRRPNWREYASEIAVGVISTTIAGIMVSLIVNVIDFGFFYSSALNDLLINLLTIILISATGFLVNFLFAYLQRLKKPFTPIPPTINNQELIIFASIEQEIDQLITIAELPIFNKQAPNTFNQGIVDTSLISLSNEKTEGPNNGN